MSAVATKPATEPGAASRPRSRVARLLTSSVGLKIIMAVTGVMLSAFVLIHMLGNLQIFQGPEAIDGYSKLLHKEPAILWSARAGLLGAVGLHIWAYLVLTQKNQRARGVNYRETKHRESSYASRSMRLTGPLLLAFIIYHILHLTTGTVHQDYHEGSVYQNLITGLRVPLVAIIYVAAMGMLGLHLWHGVWSMFQTLGTDQARYGSPGRRIATVFTIVVVLGFAIVPLGIAARLIK
jgi:succinate dehydrogenase / fumarate reductase, cytochrome b subunit